MESSDIERRPAGADTANASPPQSGRPARHLSIFDAVCVVVGIVVATGIFKSPQLVAANTAGPWSMLGAWAFGGFLCFCGALTYADLAAACPGFGGEYLYLSRSLGRGVGFLFVWARMTVIQTGAIAALAYVFGVYMVRLTGGQAHEVTYWALASVVVLTTLNAIGLHVGKFMQNVLTAAKVAGLVAIAVLGLTLGEAPTSGGASPTGSAGPFGLAMVFVLYTYGGWNEAAYVAAELRGRRGRNMLWVLVVGIVLITLLYLGVNVAYLSTLGFEGIRASDVAAAEAMAAVFGPSGAAAVSVLVAVAALGAIDGCIFTGARAIHAWGNDYPAFGLLGRWSRRLGSPVAALVAQEVIAVVLVLLPALSETLRTSLGGGFELAVAYTAPVFWAFLLLTGVCVFVLRLRRRATIGPLGRWVPMVTAAILCATCGYMIYSSIAYARKAALLGVGVLAAGVPVYLLVRSRRET